ncbi:hypothetical protein AAFC00_006553 [Neodothiora populina]|uniref:Pyridoxal-dependent decarboxylase n=1 Tax=Neodothiora populina TaxID=2781224 RepID=A0ABR3PAC0_9PEZI
METHVLPQKSSVDKARSSIIATLSDEPRDDATCKDVISALTQGLNQASLSSRYYGFVIGGATPISRFADNKVTEFDQNVHVHLPDETIATDIEHAASKMLCDLVNLDPQKWTHRIFTTGATASNVVGLALGREHVIRQAGLRENADGSLPSVAQLGLLRATRLANVDEIQILTTVPHSSIRKAAALVGLGHQSVKDVGRDGAAEKHLFDFDKLELELQKSNTASIIAVSACEVNTGLFATRGADDFGTLRLMADKYGAWIHVDAAIGLLARVLLGRKGTAPQWAEYEKIMAGVEGLELADSIGGDAHKLFNVPYDCGILLSRHLSLAQAVFQNPGAAYLSTSTSKTNTNINTNNSAAMPSPLNIGIENSRRFRALPVYANLIRYGRAGYEDILLRQIELAREIARFILQHDAYELLPPLESSTIPASEARHRDDERTVENKRLEDVFMIVCFRAVDDGLNGRLADAIKKTHRVYVSGTSFHGAPAVRFAVSNYQVNVDEDLTCIKEVLNEVAHSNQ